MDCATMRSDVIGDFQEPYGAVLIEGEDMTALPSNRRIPKLARIARSCVVSIQGTLAADTNFCRIFAGPSNWVAKW